MTPTTRKTNSERAMSEENPPARAAKPKKLTEAQRTEIRELFEDIYLTRKWQVIRMNFLRGLSFGLGTFLGGTVVVAILIWILSQTSDIFPWAHYIVNTLKKN